MGTPPIAKVILITIATAPLHDGNMHQSEITYSLNYEAEQVKYDNEILNENSCGGIYS